MAQSGGRGGKALNRIKSGAVSTGTNKVQASGAKIPGGNPMKSLPTAGVKGSGQKKRKVD
jgi:hypothetical protein